MRSSRWILALFQAAFVSALCVSAPAAAKPPAKPAATKTDAKKAEHTGKKPGASRTPETKKKGAVSLGAPNAGKLRGGEKLTSNRSLEVRGGAHAYGLPELVKVLKRAASKVNRKHKGSVLFVGDLSAKKGGALFGHNSHQSGRDADVGFYMLRDGKHTNPHRFVTFGGDGRGRGGELAVFDDERNWAFVEALLTDEKTDVRYLFVSMGLRTRLLKFAAKKNVPKELYTKAAAALMSPADADVHDDHFHVRISCPERMRPECVEESRLPSKGEATASAPAKAAAPAATKDEAAKVPAPDAQAADAKDAAAPKAEASEAPKPHSEDAP